ARKAAREHEQDRQPDRQADDLTEQRRPPGEQPADVALPVDPVAAALPERGEPERERNRPGDERGDGADHHALADAPELPGPRQTRPQADEHDERRYLHQGRKHPVPAQEAVEARRAVQPDERWCLGDLVGYGPRPNPCCEAVQERAAICLAGNHDLGVLGQLDLEEFAPDAVASAVWTRDVLKDEARSYLESLSPQ